MKNFEEYQQNIYQTGSTTPPKSRQGIIAFLIILVIFLCGIISILGMMNIRLFQMLKTRDSAQNTAVAFSRQQLYDEQAVPGLGVTALEISELCRDYYDWPQGLYISCIAPGSPAEQADLRCGDIIRSVNNVPVHTEAELLEYISTGKLRFTVYRDGKTQTIIVTTQENH